MKSIECRVNCPWGKAEALNKLDVYKIVSDNDFKEKVVQGKSTRDHFC